MGAYLAGFWSELTTGTNVSNVLEYNGFFTEGSLINGRPSYTKTTSNTDLSIFWDGDGWIIGGLDNGEPVLLAQSTDNVTQPWLVTTWITDLVDMLEGIYIFQTPLASNNILVSDVYTMSDNQLNVDISGTYFYDGNDINGYPIYFNEDRSAKIYFSTNSWAMSGILPDSYPTPEGGSNLSPPYPWLQLYFPYMFDGGGGAYYGSVTEIIPPTPSQPTFGLPADTVALITSRFGTVANFLRLRNQGQV